MSGFNKKLAPNLTLIRLKIHFKNLNFSLNDLFIPPPIFQN